MMRIIGKRTQTLKHRNIIVIVVLANIVVYWRVNLVVAVRT